LDKYKRMTSEESNERTIIIKIGMGTSGLASGAKEIYEYFNNELKKRNIEAKVISTGDIGYCYAEPTVEVTMPGKNPILFGYVTVKKADEIIENYIINKTVVEGVIPVNYEKATY